MPTEYERTPPKPKMPEEVILQTKRLLRPPSYQADFDMDTGDSYAQVFDDNLKEAKLDNLIKTCVAAGLKGNSFVKVMTAFLIYFDRPEDDFISRRTFERKKKSLFKDIIDEHLEESSQVRYFFLHSVEIYEFFCDTVFAWNVARSFTKKRKLRENDLQGSPWNCNYFARS